MDASTDLLIVDAKSHFTDNPMIVSDNATLNESHVTFTGGTTYPPEIPIPLPLDLAYTLCEIFIGIIAIIGNLLVIIVFTKYRNLRTVTNYYVISLATADLAVGCFGVPFAIATHVGLPKNIEGCLFMNSLLMSLCTSSIASLVAVTIDRYWAIIYPLTYSSHMTHKSAIIVITLSWIAAVFIGLLPVFGWNLGPPPHPRCFFMEVMDMHYLVFIFISTILTPSIFMAIVYGRIYFAVKRQLRVMAQQTYSQDGELICSKAEVKAAKSLATIVILFVISWMPLYLLNTIMCFCDLCFEAIPWWVIKVTIVLSHANSAWNPALYAWGMAGFRKALKKLLWYGLLKKGLTPRWDHSRVTNETKSIPKSPTKDSQHLTLLNGDVTTGSTRMLSSSSATNNSSTDLTGMKCVNSTTRMTSL
ncbi:unnamed protein product [Owenia fusiformis]|uniref:Uncharacterized protein n=1 Tax=Owenia fusiformis TaxID=6347 RepID=A0A8J1XP37_OWEFU|nr:unnamed protein product [Owenia fusiformis]